MTVTEVARASLPTPFGPFHAHAFRCLSGHVYLALVKGDVTGGETVTVRVHSECLTGDVFGSLRCDCGIQLRTALRAIATLGRGVLVYATGHEGRGIGLVNKLRAYLEQESGSDTVDANLHLGLPVDARTYDDSAEVLLSLGVTRVRLMSSNPRKVQGLRAHGIEVDEVVPVPVAPHLRNVAYLNTKQQRLGHTGAVIPSPPLVPQWIVDVRDLLGTVAARAQRPYVIVKYAQSLDGRIATWSGESKWISGDDERAASHAMRAHCDCVMAGIGTVLADDPRLTVRLVPGSSPIRAVLDSSLKIPADANVLNDDAATIVLTTEASPVGKREALRKRGIDVRVLPQAQGRVSLPAALASLRSSGVNSVLVEGGAKVITSLLASRSLVDRLVVAIAPRVLGRGTEGVGDLGVRDIRSGIPLLDHSVRVLGEDIVVAANVGGSREANGPGSDEDLSRSSEVVGVWRA